MSVCVFEKSEFCVDANTLLQISCNSKKNFIQTSVLNLKEKKLKKELDFFCKVALKRRSYFLAKKIKLQISFNSKKIIIWTSVQNLKERNLKKELNFCCKVHKKV